MRWQIAHKLPASLILAMVLIALRQLGASTAAEMVISIPDQTNPLTGRVIAWSSDNTTVATVSTSGLVTGKGAGSATITAASGGKSGTSAIAVANVTIASVTVSPASASLFVGQMVQLTATPKDSAGNPLTGQTIVWSSSDTTIAKVSGSGLV